MRRRDLEHIVRAAADIADDDEIVVIGSQSILGQHPDAPDELCVSVEAYVYPKNKPARADLIDGPSVKARRSTSAAKSSPTRSKARRRPPRSCASLAPL